MIIEYAFLMFFSKPKITKPRPQVAQLFEIEDLNKFVTCVYEIWQGPDRLALSTFRIDHDIARAGSNLLPEQLLSEDLSPHAKDKVPLVVEDVLQFQGLDRNGRLTFKPAYGNAYKNVIITMDYHDIQSCEEVGLAKHTSPEQEFILRHQLHPSP